jgi:conjugal transfer pilus assembly protein TraB
MGIKDIFSRERKPLDAPEAIDGDGVSPIASELDGNVETRKKQRMKLAAGCGVVLVASSFWIFGGDDAAKKIDPDSADKKTVSVSDMTNKTKSEQEWMAQSENRFQSNENQLKGVEGTNARVAQLAEQLDAMRAQNQSMSADGQRVVSAYQAENDQLRRQVNERAATPASMPGPQAMYGPGSAALYGRPGATGAPGPDLPPARLSEVKMVSFGSAGSGNASKVSKGSTVYTDSPNYLPANSFASAKVVVGVDASAGVNSQSDPLPVVLRITGPARSVLQNGKLLTTKIQGCLINGAARGDLSSEKVYIKLQKMTCPQPGGRYAESEVKGFIAFGGKTGVRGRVVSREGSLAMQAFFAGLVGGAGTALNTAFNAPLATIATSGNGDLNHTPNLGNVGLRAIGGGAQESGKDLSKYLIERAEQYQPVIEMPTGVDVEIVFLEGVYVRN